MDPTTNPTMDPLDTTAPSMRIECSLLGMQLRAAALQGLSVAESRERKPRPAAGGLPGYLAQFMLFVVAFGSLMLKRHREQPQRPLRVWGMDVSKQV
jgi:hypothetical protein